MPAAAPAPPLTMERIRAAQEILEQVVPASPLVSSSKLCRPGDGWVWLKLENTGPTGSFKLRGAYHAIHARQQQLRGKLPGVVTSSTGNHGAAVAHAARLLHLPARIYLPENPNSVKKARIAESGAEVVEAGQFLEETRKHAAKFAAESGWYDLVDGVDGEMLAGTATIGCEILDQLPGTDAIFIPVGDSTLIRGLAFAAKHLRPAVKIVGVQAERAPAYALSFSKGHAVSTGASDTMADGLAVREASAENVRQMATLIDEFVLVSEEEMLAAVRHLLMEEHAIAEPAGAATTAAFLKSAKAYAQKTVVLLVTGSNVTEEILLRALQSGK